jgi:hypothetical protein
METLQQFTKNQFPMVWGYDETGNANDTRIIVRGTRNEELALNLAKEKFKTEVTDVNGCMAYRWGAYPDDSDDIVYVTMGDVG